MDSADLERWLDEELKGLPRPRAPETLAPRVLQAVAKRPDASPETILAVLRATAAMSSGFEASQVLLSAAATHPIAGPARDAYIDAAEKLGDFEQGRVLAALVRSERRK